MSCTAYAFVLSIGQRFGRVVRRCADNGPPRIGSSKKYRCESSFVVDISRQIPICYMNGWLRHDRLASQSLVTYIASLKSFFFSKYSRHLDAQNELRFANSD